MQQRYETLQKSTHKIPIEANFSIKQIAQTNGYDGHCLRAYNYYSHLMPDIVDTVDSINSIENLYPKERQDSKAPTFALTYLGTFITLMNNCGMSEQEAKRVETNYHEMYKVSDEWVQAKLEQASKDGYIDVAFGFRVRTPLLNQCIFGSYMPREAQEESRTAGNALGQSYGLLNNRAAIEFRRRLLNSEYRTKILPCALIHDAIYTMIINDVNAVHWTNLNLPECMAWQELPEIQHPIVKLGGDLELYYPSWKYKFPIPNGATKDEIIAITSKKS